MYSPRFWTQIILDLRDEKFDNPTATLLFTVSGVHSDRFTVSGVRSGPAQCSAPCKESVVNAQLRLLQCNFGML